jgi:hypothetical protein
MEILGVDIGFITLEPGVLLIALGILLIERLAPGVAENDVPLTRWKKARREGSAGKSSWLLSDEPPP